MPKRSIRDFVMSIIVGCGGIAVGITTQKPWFPWPIVLIVVAMIGIVGFLLEFSLFKRTRQAIQQSTRETFEKLRSDTFIKTKFSSDGQLLVLRAAWKKEARRFGSAEIYEVLRRIEEEISRRHLEKL